MESDLCLRCAPDARWFKLIGAMPAPDTPLLLDLPHGGGEWPAGVLPARLPAAGRDHWRDPQLTALWCEAAAGLAPVLAARFHRACIDLNRARDDIDPDMLVETWPDTLVPCPTSHRGIGLIRRYSTPGHLLYEQRLPIADVQQRLDLCYDPYHQALACMIEGLHTRFALSLHLCCLSMKPVGDALNLDCGAWRPDVSLADLDGSSADPFLLRWMAATLQGFGLDVAVNRPHHGGEILARHGRPAHARHSVQLVLNRRLYTERDGSPSRGRAQLVRLLRRFLQQLATGLTMDLLPDRSSPGTMFSPAPCRSLAGHSTGALRH